MSPTDGSGMSDSETVVDARAGHSGLTPPEPVSGARITATPIAIVRVQKSADAPEDGDENDIRCQCTKYVLAEADEAVVIPPDERHTVTECVTQAA